MRRLIDNGNRPITPKPHIGHYGRLRKAYLEQYRHRLYTALVASEKLYPHLAETDRAARDMLDYLMPRLAREGKLHSDIYLHLQRPPKIERLANFEPIGRCKIPLN